MSTSSAYAGDSHPFNGTATHVSKKQPVPLRVEDFENGIWNNESDENKSQQEDYRQKFLDSILDQKKDYPLPEAIVSIVQNGQVLAFLTLMSFSLWQGKQKSKKTTVLAMTVAAFLLGGFYNDTDDIQIIGSKPGKVIFFDNEQGESYAARTMKLILKLSGLEESPNLIYCDLRKYLPQERKNIIIAGIESTLDVKLVVIDGLVDLMQDFMDAGEGHLTITDIIRLCSSYKIHIAGVLHQNKADANARAHIGSIASQKCEMEISTEVDKNDRTRSIVKCVNSRGMPFEDFAIQWDRVKGALPKICQGWSASGNADEEAKNKKHNQAYHRAYGVFAPPKSLSYADAIKAIEESRGISTSTAKRWLAEFVELDLVEKGDDGNYRFKVQTGSK